MNKIRSQTALCMFMHHVSCSWTLTCTPLLSDLLKTVVFVGMLTDPSFVRSPSTTSRSFCRWTRRYRANSPVSTAQTCPVKTALCSLLHPACLRTPGRPIWLASGTSSWGTWGVGRSLSQCCSLTRWNTAKTQMCTTTETNCGDISLPCSLIMCLYVSSSWLSCSLKRILCATLDFRLLFLMTWKGRCLSIGSPLHTTRRSQHLCLFSNVHTVC